MRPDRLLPALAAQPARKPVPLAVFVALPRALAEQYIGGADAAVAALGAVEGQHLVEVPSQWLTQLLSSADGSRPAADHTAVPIEGRTLRGAAATLARCRPFVLFEDKPHKAEAQGTKGEAHDILLAAGAHLIERIGVRGNDWLYGFDPAQ